MAWLEDRVLGGGTVFLVFHYINALWEAGIRAGNDDPDKDLRVTAGGIALYAYQLIVIDGVRCEGQSTADMHMRDLLRQRAVAHLKKQAVETKIKVVDLALRMEQATAQKRQDDDWLCRGGARAPAPFRYVSKVLPSERYAPLQEKARASMREQLLRWSSEWQRFGPPGRTRAPNATHRTGPNQRRVPVVLNQDDAASFV